KGTSYLSSSVDLEDNLAVLTSNKIMTSTLQRLDFGITYYATKYFLKKELYAYPPFFVKLDSMAIQVIDLPVEVEVDRAARTYRVKAEGKNVRLYNMKTQEVLPELIAKYQLDQVVPMDSMFVGDRLSFRIRFPEDRVYDSNTKY